MDMYEGKDSELHNSAEIYANDNENVFNSMLNSGNHVTDIFNSGSKNDGNTRIVRESVLGESHSKIDLRIYWQDGVLHLM